MKKRKEKRRQTHLQLLFDLLSGLSLLSKPSQVFEFHDYSFDEWYK